MGGGYYTQVLLKLFRGARRNWKLELHKTWDDHPVFPSVRLVHQRPGLVAADSSAGTGPVVEASSLSGVFVVPSVKATIAWLLSLGS